MFLWLINPEWMHAIHCLYSFPPSSLSHSVFLESESKNMATGLSFEALCSATKIVSTELGGFFMLWRKKKVSLGLMWEVVFYLYWHMYFRKSFNFQDCGLIQCQGDFVYIILNYCFHSICSHPYKHQLSICKDVILSLQYKSPHFYFILGGILKYFQVCLPIPLI